MGGFDEEVYFSLFRTAEAMSMQASRGPMSRTPPASLEVPGRAEPLYMIARWYRRNQRFWLRSCSPHPPPRSLFPQDDTLLVDADIYTWRALDEQAVCASRVGSHIEAFVLCRQLLAMPDIPTATVSGSANRDVSVPSMVDAASTYPDQLVPALVTGPAPPTSRQPARRADNHERRSIIPELLHGHPRRDFCCSTRPAEPDRSALHEQYPFVEIVDRAAPTGRTRGLDI